MARHTPVKKRIWDRIYCFATISAENWHLIKLICQTRALAKNGKNCMSKCYKYYMATKRNTSRLDQLLKATFSFKISCMHVNIV